MLALWYSNSSPQNCENMFRKSLVIFLWFPKTPCCQIRGHSLIFLDLSAAASRVDHNVFLKARFLCSLWHTFYKSCLSYSLLSTMDPPSRSLWLTPPPEFDLTFKVCLRSHCYMHPFVVTSLVFALILYKCRSFHIQFSITDISQILQNHSQLPIWHCLLHV